ncbi:nicotinate phosphoribosyltransferase [Paenibacillus sp. N1-5-1-14]|uniref:nicotinate phosphoribosyltransferase n=1 Tax=Paenibacillus radicibacter TaxID=2972488 RepID=UPI00215976FF|nr:nicotinate phosphoribosyltransferase [Paenibacillus radicibacter]MCR8641234.1 nicotinate phosphoribosyltransferase [Paenibacillus radicibacter]
MNKQYPDDSMALHTDLYQINMAESYFADQIHNRRAVFECYFRKMPFGNGYAMFAGLERLVEYIQSFQFQSSDLDYLKNELGYADDYLDYLSTMKFTGNIQAMREGEFIFANEPIVRVEGNLAEAQIIETALLNIINYQTLIATKASRIKQVVGDQRAMEFGTRRAHEMDAAIWGTRAAYIGGFEATSNVRAGKKFGIPVAGTHAHSFVQAYGGEYEAFHAYARRHRDCVFLVDTYDTLKSGVPNAIRVAQELGSKINFVGIRLDSGDLAYLSKEARRMLDQAGFTKTQIIASNDLDEGTIMNLRMQGARIDVWGIGTKLITAFDQPALGAVYKIVAIEDDQGQMIDTIKISGNPEKMSTPGMKTLYRIINNINNRTEGDYLAMADERPNEEERIKMFHPTYTSISKWVTNFEARKLLSDIYVDGCLVYELPDIQTIHQFANNNMNLLWDEYKRTLNPEAYPVDLSQKCWDNKMRVMEEVKRKLEETPNN